ncbi:MAG: hypothetical protein Q9187_003962 [Circinaria calcarea]
MSGWAPIPTIDPTKTAGFGDAKPASVANQQPLISPTSSMVEPQSNTSPEDILRSLDLAGWVPIATIYPTKTPVVESPGTSLVATESAQTTASTVAEDNHLEIRQQLIGVGGGAPLPAPLPTQVSPVTTIFIHGIQVVYTQRFSAVPSQGPSALPGKIGLGTLTGSIGVVKTAEASKSGAGRIRSGKNMLSVGVLGSVFVALVREVSLTVERFDGVHCIWVPSKSMRLTVCTYIKYEAAKQTYRLANAGVAGYGVMQDTTLIRPLPETYPPHCNLSSLSVKHLIISMFSTREQIPPRSKGQHTEVSSSLDNPSELQPSKRLKSSIRLHSVAFYDSLSKVRLTRRALKELDRRTNQVNSTTRPASVRRQRDREDIWKKQIQKFARHGGPDLRDLRGVKTGLPKTASFF